MSKHQGFILSAIVWQAIVMQAIVSQSVCSAEEGQIGGLFYTNRAASIPESIDKSYLDDNAALSRQDSSASINTSAPAPVAESGDDVPFPFSESGPSSYVDQRLYNRSLESRDLRPHNERFPTAQKSQSKSTQSAFYQFEDFNDGLGENGIPSAEFEDKPMSRLLPVKPMIEDKQGRNGIFQKITGKTTFVSSGGGVEGLGMTTINLDLVLGFPLPTRQSPLLLTPYFQADFMDYSAVYSGTPESLYRTGLNVAWMKQLNDRWGMFLFASPCVSSDFQADFDNAFRCPAGIIANWTINPAWKLSLGVIYTDNDDWLFVPACGVTWTPNDLWKWELTVPRPRICRRINDPFRNCYFVRPGRNPSSYWVYLAGEYQGGTWAVEAKERWGARDDDRLQYRDLRIMFGIERDKKEPGRIDWNAEIGMAFCRKMYFEDLPTVFHPKTAFVARIQAVF